ncbi:hypothetical protein DSECCO2_250600 [anaerobic digester metagenome]
MPAEQKRKSGKCQQHQRCVDQPAFPPAEQAAEYLWITKKEFLLAVCVIKPASAGKLPESQLRRPYQQKTRHHHNYTRVIPEDKPQPFSEAVSTFAGHQQNDHAKNNIGRPDQYNQTEQETQQQGLLYPGFRQPTLRLISHQQDHRKTEDVRHGRLMGHIPQHIRAESHHHKG